MILSTLDGIKTRFVEANSQDRESVIKCEWMKFIGRYKLIWNLKFN